MQNTYKLVIILGLGTILFTTAEVVEAGSGDISITEITYDPVGTDSGREWVEIFAPGEAGDLTGYFLRENEVNHGIKEYEEHTVDSASDYAIIADNPSKFLIDFPEYKGYLYDSAFSLKNTGEMISLVSKDQDVVFTYTYEPIDEKYEVLWSLQSGPDGWVAAEASPGSGSIQSLSSSSSDSSGKEDISDQVKKSIKKKDIEEYSIDRTIEDIDLQKKIRGIVAVPIRFNPFSVKTLKRTSKKMHWSYGDGTSEVTERPSHTYAFPGQYLLIGSLMYGDNLEHVAYGKIIVSENPIVMKSIDAQGRYIEIENTSPDVVNIEKFRVSLGSGKSYLFPRNTLILGNMSIKIPFSTLNIFQRGVDYNNTDPFGLEYPRSVK